MGEVCFSYNFCIRLCFLLERPHSLCYIVTRLSMYYYRHGNFTLQWLQKYSTGLLRYSCIAL